MGWGGLQRRRLDKQAAGCSVPKHTAACPGVQHSPPVQSPVATGVHGAANVRPGVRIPLQVARGQAALAPTSSRASGLEVISIFSLAAASSTRSIALSAAGTWWYGWEGAHVNDK